MLQDCKSHSQPRRPAAGLCGKQIPISKICAFGAPRGMHPWQLRGGRRGHTHPAWTQAEPTKGSDSDNNNDNDDVKNQETQAENDKPIQLAPLRMFLPDKVTGHDGPGEIPWWTETRNDVLSVTTHLK